MAPQQLTAPTECHIAAEPMIRLQKSINLRPTGSWCTYEHIFKHGIHCGPSVAQKPNSRTQLGHAVLSMHTPPGHTVIAHVSFPAPHPVTLRRLDTVLWRIGTNDSQNLFLHLKAQGSNRLIHQENPNIQATKQGIQVYPPLPTASQPGQL